MDRLYFKILQETTELAMNAIYLTMNANYRDDIEQVTRPYLSQIYEVVNNARDVINTALMRQKVMDLKSRDDLINGQRS